MTAKTVEDLFLIDDLRAHRGSDLIVDDLEACATHEEFAAVRAKWVTFFDRLGL